MLKIKKNWIWDVLEIDWSDVSITLNDNEKDLPSSAIIPFKERYRARRFSLVLEPRNLCIANDSNSKFLRVKQLGGNNIMFYILDNMARSLNSRCGFENGFFTCDLPEDVFLILKVKTQTGNHTLVEDMEKQTEKFQPWKKQAKDGKQVPWKIPGVLSPRKNDNSITSDSGPCPSLTEHEYKPSFFDEPDWMSSDKENMPLTESITPPSLRNLSLEEEADDKWKWSYIMGGQCSEKTSDNP